MAQAAMPKPNGLSSEGNDIKPVIYRGGGGGGVWWHRSDD